MRVNLARKTMRDPKVLTYLREHPAVRFAADHGGDRLGRKLASLWVQAPPVLIESRIVAKNEVNALFPRDWQVLVLLLIAVLAFAPLITRSTDSALHLASFVNDEPALTMALDAMTHWPLGNPANLYGQPGGIPAQPSAEWAGIGYFGFNYYGGAYLGLGFVSYAPLSFLGAPAFPTAAIILRIVSALAGILSIWLVYGLGKKYVHGSVGFVAAVFLLTEPGFIYYSLIIHPDTLQLLVGLLFLVFAIRHAEDGRMASLFLMACVLGLSQGTKLGAVWSLPTALLAVYFGVMLSRGMPVGTAVLAYAKRVLALGVVSILVWLASTPYVLGSYYLGTIISTWSAVTSSDLASGSAVQWLAGISENLGPVLTGLACGSLVWVFANVLRGKAPKALVLMAVLAVSQILYFTLLSKVWVVVYYLILGFSLLTILYAAMIKDTLDWLFRGAGLRRVALLVLVGPVFAVLLLQRGASSVELVGKEYLRENSTVAQLNSWAESYGLSRDANVVWDDIAYLDPNIHPNGKMHGGLMRWFDLRFYDPDYVVLSSSIYESAWWARQIQEQTYERDSQEQLSVRLYQDFLGTNTDGAPAYQWIEEVGVVGPTAPPAPYDAATSAVFNVLSDVPVVGPGLAAEYAKFQTVAQRIVRIARNIAGTRRDITGPTLRVFRIAPAKEACGRESAFASSTLNTAYRPVYAFDGMPGRAWTSKERGATVTGEFVGIDFGCKTELAGASVAVEWGLPADVPTRLTIEVSDDGETWIAMGEYDPQITKSGDIGQISVFDLSQTVRSRFWRVKAIGDSPDGGFFIRDIRITN